MPTAKAKDLEDNRVSPDIEMKVWRRSRRNRAARDLPPGWVGRHTRTGILSAACEPSLAGMRAAHQHREGGGRDDPTQRNDRLSPLDSQQRQKHRLTCGFGARGGIRTLDPTTSRMLRVDLVGSRRIEPAHVHAASVQTASEGSRPIVWMISGMIKAHPTLNRMPTQAP